MTKVRFQFLILSRIFFLFSFYLFFFSLPHFHDVHLMRDGNERLHFSTNKQMNRKMNEWNERNFGWNDADIVTYYIVQLHRKMNKMNDVGKNGKKDSRNKECRHLITAEISSLWISFFFLAILTFLFFFFFAFLIRISLDNNNFCNEKLTLSTRKIHLYFPFYLLLFIRFSHRLNRRQSIEKTKRWRENYYCDDRDE